MEEPDALNGTAESPALEVPPPSDEIVEEKEVAILPAVTVVNTYPGGAPPASSNSLVNKNAISPIIQLTEAIGSREEFIFQSDRRIGFDARAATTQICGTDGSSWNTIMTTMIDPGVTIRHTSVKPNNAHTFRTGAITKFLNAEGATIMTCRETGQAQTVSSGDRVFGLIDGIGLYSTELKARVPNPKGEMLFQTSENNGIFFFRSKEVEIAQAGVGVTKSVDKFGFTFSPDLNLDMSMKAMVLATAYYIYYLHVANTIFGLKGSKGVALGRCFIGIGGVVIILIIVIAIVIFIIHS